MFEKSINLSLVMNPIFCKIDSKLKFLLKIFFLGAKRICAIEKQFCPFYINIRHFPWSDY